MNYGTTDTYPFPLVNRQDNPYNTEAPEFKRYWPQPCADPLARLVRLDVLTSEKYDESALQILTVTLVDMDANEIVRDCPLLLLLQSARLKRPRMFRPFLWDPMKSFIYQPVRIIQADILFVAHFVKP